MDERIITTLECEGLKKLDVIDSLANASQPMPSVAGSLSAKKTKRQSSKELMVRGIVKLLQPGHPVFLQIVANALGEAVDLPDDTYPQIFRICCENVEIGMEKKVLSRAFSQGRPSAKWKSAIELMITSLWMIGTKSMLLKISDGRQEAEFAPLILKHWGCLISASMDLLELSKLDGKVGRPTLGGVCSHLDTLYVACNVMMSLLMSGSFPSIVADPSVLFDFAWTLWLSGGTRNHEINSSKRFNSSIAFLLTLLAAKFLENPIHLHKSSALKLSQRYGGTRCIARIALSSFKCGSVYEQYIIPHVMLPFRMFISSEDFLTAICEEDGMAIIIDGLTHLSKLGGKGNPALAGFEMIFTTLFLLLSDSHRNAECAARSGILGAFIAFERDVGKSSPEGMMFTTRLLQLLPGYFIYHSVTKAFAEELRKLTEGDTSELNTCNIFTSDAELAEAWQYFKRALMDKYCTMRVFDLMAFPEFKLKYCNTCWISNNFSKLRRCKCRHAFYCSETCQITDSDHQEICKNVSGRFDLDIPFLCFLTNLNLSTRSEILLKNTSEYVTPEDMVYRVWFNGARSTVLSATSTLGAVQDYLSQAMKDFLDPKARSMRVYRTPDLDRESVDKKPIEVRIGSVTVNTLRYFYFNPDPRFNVTRIDQQASSESADPKSIKGSREKVSDLGYKSIDSYDVVDYIFSKFYIPGEDPWTYHLCGDFKRRSDRKHILDFVDDCIKELSDLGEGSVCM